MVDPSLLDTPSPAPWYRRAGAALWSFLTGGHGFELSRPARTRVGIALLGLMALASWATWRLLAAFAVLSPQPDSPAWELALQARLVLFRAKVALGLALGVLLLAWLAFLALDRTRLGKRLMHWSPGMDSERSCAAKTHTAGLAFVGLLLTFGLIAAQVLR